MGDRSHDPTLEANFGPHSPRYKQVLLSHSMPPSKILLKYPPKKIRISWVSRAVFVEHTLVNTFLNFPLKFVKKPKMLMI